MEVSTESIEEVEVKECVNCSCSEEELNNSSVQLNTYKDSSRAFGYDEIHICTECMYEICVINEVDTSNLELVCF
jgi:hypothetical protein